MQIDNIWPVSSSQHPLLLDNPSSGPSDFQSNGIGPSCSTLASGPKHGLGLRIQPEKGGLLCAEKEDMASSDYSATSDLTHHSQGSHFSSGIPQANIQLSGRNKATEAIYSLSELTGKVLLEDDYFHDQYSTDSDDQYFSVGLSRLLSSLTDSDSSSLSTLNSSSSFTGPVADINMFRSIDTSGGPCIRPQDLIRSDDQTVLEVPKFEAQESPHASTSHDFDSLSPLAKEGSQIFGLELENRKSHLALNAPIRDGYFMPIKSPQLIKHEEVLPLQSYPPIGAPFPLISKVPHQFPYLQDNAGMLQFPVELPPLEGDPWKARTALSNKTNIMGNIPRAKSSVNVLDLQSDSQIPFDVVLTNAHEGVSVEIVAQKTRFYIMTHPGERLSDELLFTFAGRLSAEGESIQGYRCYITGCEKTTKRKDHMGDHIRTHLGEKPFQCSIW